MGRVPRVSASGTGTLERLPTPVTTLVQGRAVASDSGRALGAVGTRVRTFAGRRPTKASDSQLPSRSTIGARTDSEDQPLRAGCALSSSRLAPSGVRATGASTRAGVFRNYARRNVIWYRDRILPTPVRTSSTSTKRPRGCPWLRPNASGQAQLRRLARGKQPPSRPIQPLPNLPRIDPTAESLPSPRIPSGHRR